MRGKIRESKFISLRGLQYNSQTEEEKENTPSQNAGDTEGSLSRGDLKELKGSPSKSARTPRGEIIILRN